MYHVAMIHFSPGQGVKIDEVQDLGLMVCADIFKPQHTNPPFLEFQIETEHWNQSAQTHRQLSGGIESGPCDVTVS